MKKRTLASLQIPTGWFVLFNNFVCFEDGELPTDDDLECYLIQDILAMRQLFLQRDGVLEEENALQIFLGWYPDGDSEGGYRLDVRRKSRVEVIASFECRSFSVIRGAVNLGLFLGARFASDSEIKMQLSAFNGEA